jgi:DNA-binding GntR family transcriptional regulator
VSVNPGERLQEAYQEHWQILQAIKSGDPGLVESLMRSHVARASDNIVRALTAAEVQSDSDIVRHA